MKRFLGFAALAAVILGLSLAPMRGQAQSGASCPITLQAPVLNTSATTYTLSATDGCKMLVFSASGAVTVTPPTPASNLPVGFSVWLRSQGAGGIVLATPATSSVLIDGVNGPVTIAQGDGIAVLTDGTNYYTTGLGVNHHP